MTKSYQTRKFDEAVTWLREHGFDLLEAPGVSNRIFLKKDNCSAAVQKDEKTGEVRIFATPGYLIRGEISKLVDRGYQKFLKTTKTEIPATADHLKAIHNFSEALKEATGIPSLYNEAIGTVSDSYQYDRIVNRDEPEPARPKRPWELLRPRRKSTA